MILTFLSIKNFPRAFLEDSPKQVITFTIGKITFLPPQKELLRFHLLPAASVKHFCLGGWKTSVSKVLFLMQLFILCDPITSSWLTPARVCSQNLSLQWELRGNWSWLKVITAASQSHSTNEPLCVEGAVAPLMTASPASPLIWTLERALSRAAPQWTVLGHRYTPHQLCVRTLSPETQLCSDFARSIPLLFPSHCLVKLPDFWVPAKKPHRPSTGWQTPDSWHWNIKVVFQHICCFVVCFITTSRSLFSEQLVS